MNLPANPVFPDDKKTSMENNIVASKPKAKKEALQATGVTTATGTELSVLGINNDPKEASPGEFVTYKVVQYSKLRSLVSPEEKKRIRWLVKVGNYREEFVGKEGKEDEFEIKMEDGWVGQDIIVMAGIDGRFKEDISRRTKVIKRLIVEKVEGAAKTYPRQKIVYKAEYNKKRSEMTDREKNKEIKWAIKVGNSDITDLENKKGEKITLDIKPEWGNNNVNNIILVMAYIEGTEKKGRETEVLTDPYKGTTLIRGVKGEDEAFPGQEIEYEVINSNGDGSASKVADGSDVKWAIKVGKDGKIDKEMLEDRRKQKVISLKIKEEWKNNEITIMPYLNSPTETVSVKTKIGPVAKTIYITQGDAIRKVYQKWIDEKKKEAEKIIEEHRKEAIDKHIEQNRTAHETFMKFAKDAKENLETKGFNVVINPCMTKEEYIKMMKDPMLIAYYMDAHSNSSKEEEVKGFLLLKHKPNFNDSDWSMKKINNENDLIEPIFFTNNKISSRDLLLVYQVSCGNKFIKWREHLGESVQHFNKDVGDGEFPSTFDPSRIKKFADKVIEKWNNRERN